MKKLGKGTIIAGKGALFVLIIALIILSTGTGCNNDPGDVRQPGAHIVAVKVTAFDIVPLGVSTLATEVSFFIENDRRDAGELQGIHLDIGVPSTWWDGDVNYYATGADWSGSVVLPARKTTEVKASFAFKGGVPVWRFVAKLNSDGSLESLFKGTARCTIANEPFNITIAQQKMTIRKP